LEPHIFTYRDERKLLALIAVIIAAAGLALVQITAARSGGASPVGTVATSFTSLAQSAISAVVGGVRSIGGGLLAIPGLSHDNTALRARNERLQRENATLHELIAAYAADTAVRPIVNLYPRGVVARVIGFPPENESRTVTIDHGLASGIATNDGVLGPGGVVGRVVAVGPLSSTVALITDYTSQVPAITQRGRWWGIARGNLTSVRVEYIPQDAPLKIGDAIVTGEGRVFPSGEPIGTIAAIERNDATLYQTAVVIPAVDLGALDRVVVLKK